MKRLFLMLALMSAVICAMAQIPEICFELQSDGSFKTVDGKDHVVIIYEGKSAVELYQMFLSASVKGYATERRQTSTVEGVSFAIEGMTDTLSLKGSGTLILRYDYQVMFHFKDGRVKIDAPLLTGMYAGMMMFGIVNIDNLVKQDSNFIQWVHKGSPYLKFQDGKLTKEKYMRNWKMINAKTNELINCVIRQLKVDEEDW